jgi:quercetin dioxygenase-like cupin family protein
MSEKVNIACAHDAIDEHWSPRVLGRVNDQYVKAAKLSGSLVWHKHDEEDELFLVTKGRLTIELEDRAPVHLEAGEFFVVPRGIMHNPVAREECWIVLIETVNTRHTGELVVDGTRSIEEQLG